ncbi:hypothetical protein LXL04_005931 [Taraxacum kok-saghyz]
MAAAAETLKCEDLKPIEDDWTIVIRKRTNQKRKFPKLKPSKQQEQQTQWAPTDIETTPEKELKLMHKIQISIEKLEKSQFFTAFLDQIRTPEASQHFENITESKRKLKMVIYGIGSIESYESPRLQLSLAILMKKNLEWIGDMEVFDPIISLTESKVMEELGVRVLSVNEQGKREVVDPILFFMPHCEVELYDNLLKTNWKHELLNKIILLGNSFDKYEQQHRLVSKNQDLDDSRKHLLAIKRFTKEFEIRTISDDFFRAFHGSSWHFFSVDYDIDL